MPKSNLITSLRIDTPASFALKKFRPDADFGWTEEQAESELEEVKAKLDELQQRLYAEGSRAVLVVIQAMDAAGKDGTIRNIFNGLNPAGVRVTSFKVPGGREVVQDYLWRCHAAAPGRGEIGVFNRSHYEDVLVVRVKGYAPEKRWKRRYRHIREFERVLADEGTTIVKIFLNVSKKEQARRFQDRLDDPAKQWKFRSGDLEDRALWKQFQVAYSDAIRTTSTSYAPWYVVPADHNWVRNLAVAKILLHTLESMNPQYPDPEPGLDKITIN